MLFAYIKLIVFSSDLHQSQACLGYTKILEKLNIFILRVCLDTHQINVLQLCYQGSVVRVNEINLGWALDLYVFSYTCIFNMHATQLTV